MFYVVVTIFSPYIEQVEDECEVRVLTLNLAMSVAFMVLFIFDTTYFAGYPSTRCKNDQMFLNLIIAHPGFFLILDYFLSIFTFSVNYKKI